MAYTPKSDTWISPCDLCGSLRHETLKLPHERIALRCRDCGLVTIPHADTGPRRGLAPRCELPEDLALAAIRELGRDRSMLVIGIPSTAMVMEAETAGVPMVALVEPGSGQIPLVRTQEWSLEGAAFPPDRFDFILCLHGLESFPAPSLLFDRARCWLRPGGTLMVGTLNFESLPARIRRQNWLQRYAPGAEHILSLDTLKGYAERYGLAIRSVRTRSRLDEVASIITGSERPSWLMSMAAAPLTLATSLLGMGVLIVVEMAREGLAQRPLRREPEEEMEGSPGLAPALYTSVQREAMAKCP